jgi:hypothetical protein
VSNKRYFLQAVAKGISETLKIAQAPLEPFQDKEAPEPAELSPNDINVKDEHMNANSQIKNQIHRYSLFTHSLLTSYFQLQNNRSNINLAFRISNSANAKGESTKGASGKQASPTERGIPKDPVRSGISFIESERANGIEETVKAEGFNLEDILAAIENLDLSHLSHRKMLSLVSICPTKEDRKALRAVIGLSKLEVNNLPFADKALCLLSNISRLEQRLEIMLFISNFHDRVTESHKLSAKITKEMKIVEAEIAAANVRNIFILRFL